MSSYQHQCMLGNVMRDSHPDYLTCGYCAREFLLDNITLFIAHKTGGCDQSSHFRSATSHDPEDTSSPLTCSACSRVFMTARGLLHHVQEDHQMVLCLQKGPLFLPHKEIRPPPAHSSCNGVESTRTHADQSGCCFSGSTSSCAQNDQPTDLSMTCSNSLGKARVTCSEDKCQITIEPTCKIISAKSASALPKKRKFVCPQQSKGFERECNNVDCNNESRISEGQDDVNSRGSYEHHADLTSGKEADDNDVSICVTAEYQKDTLCCVSLSTEKKEHEKHAKLKRLLQNTNPATEAEELQHQQQQLSDFKTTTVVYKVPFLAPPNPESAVLKAAAGESLGTTDSCQGSYIGAPTDDAHVKSHKVHKSNNMSRLTMEANVDRLIRSSISSESFSELDIFSLQPESLPSRQSKHHRIDDPSTPIPTSPRLLMPGEKTTLPPHISVSCLTFDGSERNSISSNIENWNNIFLSDDQNPQATSAINPVLSSSFLTVNSLRTGIAQNETLKLKNSLSFSGQSTPVSEQATLDFYSSIPLLGNHHDDHSSTQLCDRGTTFGEGLLKLLEQKKPGHSNNRQSHLLEPSVSILADLTGGNPSIQQWLNIHSEDSSNLPGTACTSRSTASEHLDAVPHENVGQSSADILDDTGLDSKAIKRRRYPTSRPFKCPSCDQAFNQRIHLKKHMSKHTGVKPFKCQQCDYSTVERSHLKVHYRIHTGEKPYRCMFCDYATAQNSTLKIHMKRHHETQIIPDCSSHRDTNFHPTGSFDDESWPMQDNVFLNPSLNTPTFDDELNRSSFLPGARTKHSLSTDNSSKGGEKGGGSTRRGSSSPSSSTDQGQEHLLFETSMQKTRTSDSVTDRISFIDADRSIRNQLEMTNRGLYDNGNAPTFINTVLKNTTTSTVNDRFSPAHEIGILSCPSSEDNIHFMDSSVPGTFENIQSPSFQVFVVKTENKIQSRNEEIVYVNNKTQLPAKSFAKRKQASKRGNIQTDKSMKSNTSEVRVYSVTEMDVPKEKEPPPVVNNSIRVQSEEQNASSEVNARGTFTSKETTNTLQTSELLGVKVEEDESECSSMDNVSVTIPTKAFVRG